MIGNAISKEILKLARRLHETKFIPLIFALLVLRHEIKKRNDKLYHFSFSSLLFSVVVVVVASAFFS